MNDVGIIHQSALNVHLLNVQLSEEICTCPIHQGELIQQIDAQLANGKHIRILLDHDGYHVVIGNPNIPDDIPCPGPVSKEIAEQMLRNAR